MRVGMGGCDVAGCGVVTPLSAQALASACLRHSTSVRSLSASCLSVRRSSSYCLSIAVKWRCMLVVAALALKTVGLILFFLAAPYGLGNWTRDTDRSPGAGVMSWRVWACGGSGRSSWSQQCASAEVMGGECLLFWGAFSNDLPFLLVRCPDLLISCLLIFCGIIFQIWGAFSNALPFLLVRCPDLLISCLLI